MKFKLFGRLMKKKPAAVPRVQTDRRDPHMIIDEMTAKGFPESEVIRALKDEGYSFKEIDDALNESVRNEVTGASPGQPPMGGGYAAQVPGQTGADYETRQEEYLDQDLENMELQDFDAKKKSESFTDSTRMGPGMEPVGVTNVSMPEEEQPQAEGQFDDQERENIYEIVESVVSERMISMRAEIKEINEQIKSIQEIISEFKSDVQEHEDERRREAGATHDKIKDNTAKIAELDPKVAGIERAFKDIVPNLVDSVREVKELVSARVGEPAMAHAVHEDVFEDTQARDELPKKAKRIFDEAEEEHATEHKKHEKNAFDEDDDDSVHDGKAKEDSDDSKLEHLDDDDEISIFDDEDERN